MLYTVLVIGGTGKQGEGVVDALLGFPSQFSVRVLTRNPTSSKASALLSRGVETVKGDVSDSDSLKTAMAGVYGVFLQFRFLEDGCF